MQHIVRDRQTLLDVAIQTSGSVELIFDAASKNNISITDGLIQGEILKTSEIIDAGTVENFKSLGVTPASLSIPLEGIGYWIIEETFEVQ